MCMNRKVFNSTLHIVKKKSEEGLGSQRIWAAQGR